MWKYNIGATLILNCCFAHLITFDIWATAQLQKKKKINIHSNLLPVWWVNWKNEAQVLTSVLDVYALFTLWAIKASLYYQEPLGSGGKSTTFAAAKHLQNKNSPNLPWREQMRVNNASGEIAPRLRQPTCYFQPRGFSRTWQRLWSQNWGERTSERFYFLTEMQAKKKKKKEKRSRSHRPPSSRVCIIQWESTNSDTYSQPDTSHRRRALKNLSLRSSFAAAWTSRRWHFTQNQVGLQCGTRG